MMQLIVVLLLVLPLICAIRINVRECPLNKTAWEAREQAFIDECKPPEVYHCIQDDHNNLFETCMIAIFVDPSFKDGCPWALHTDDGETVIGGVFNECEGPKCPKNNDPKYWTNQLYKYPICLHHYVQTTIWITESLKTETGLMNITELASRSTPGSEILQDRNDETDALPSILGAVTGAVGLVMMIGIAIVCYRKRRTFLSTSGSSPENGNVNENIKLDEVGESKVEKSGETEHLLSNDFIKTEDDTCSEDSYSSILYNACQTGDIKKVKTMIKKYKRGLNIKDNNGQTPLHYAGFSGSIELVQYLIDNGCDVYSKDTVGVTIVHKACKEGHVSLVKHLTNIDKGVLEIKDINGLIPFHYAGFSGSVELVQSLVDSGCDVYSRSHINRTILHYACQKGHVNLVTHLTKIDKGLLNTEDNNGLTPFHCAGFSRSRELVQYLIDNGCDVYSKDNVGRTIEHHACNIGHVSLVKHLIGIDKSRLKIKDNNGITPFHCAGFSGSVELVQYLIDNGCDVYSKDNGGRTIVYYACQKWRANLLKYLTDTYNGILNIKDNNGQTPLHYAGFLGLEEVVQFLIGNGCDVYSKDNGGLTIVHYACQEKHVSLVNYLTDKCKGLLLTKDNNGMTPCHYAAFSGSVELVQYLIDNGCDVYSKDNDGRTIVHYACRKGHVSLVKHLTNIKVNKSVLEIKDNNRLTPLHYAGISGSVELVKYLVDNDCDVYSEDNIGQTIVHYACREGHVSLVKHLTNKDKGVLKMKDNDGMTPFHCAGVSGSVELVQYLIDSGCDMYSKSRSGWTIVNYVIQKGHTGLLDYMKTKQGLLKI